MDVIMLGEILGRKQENCLEVSNSIIEICDLEKMLLCPLIPYTFVHLHMSFNDASIHVH